MFRKVFANAWLLSSAPAKGSDKIAADPQGFSAGLYWTLLFLVAYSVCALIGYLQGRVPVTPAFLTIPMEKWYLVQTFTTIPAGLSGFLSFSGLLYLLCRAVGGKGTFESTFASQMYALTVPTVVFMLIPELFVAPIFVAAGIGWFPWPQWVENLRVFIIPFTWIFFMSTVAAVRIHAIRWYLALLFSVLSMIPTALIMAAFIR